MPVNIRAKTQPDGRFWIRTHHGLFTWVGTKTY
jgi:hypothetical protein